MRHIVMLILLGAATSGSCSSLSANESQKPDGSVTTIEKQICRREQATGTILRGKKICKSKAEWSSIDGSRAKEVENTNRGRQSSLSPGAAD
jgi:hypothetical protein